MRTLSVRSADGELVAAFRAGDPVAFASIHARYHSVLVRFARRMLFDGDLAEDVVQEALLRASRALLRDSRPIELRPWLFRIVRNCALDELARHRFTSVPLDTETAAQLPASGAAEPPAAQDAARTSVTFSTTSRSCLPPSVTRSSRAKSKGSPTRIWLPS